MSRFHRLCRVSIALSLLGFAACGGDDDDDDDTGGDNAVDAAPADDECPMATSRGTFDPEAEAEALHLTQEKDPAQRLVTIAINVTPDESPADILVVELWDGFGAFAGGQLAAGEYALAGDETNVVSCGVCVLALGDAQLVDGVVQFEKRYVATGGTVTIDDVGTRTGNEIAGNYTGSVSDLTLAEIDESNGGALAGGCESAVAGAAWDAPISNGD